MCIIQTRIVISNTIFEIIFDMLIISRFFVWCWLVGRCRFVCRFRHWCIGRCRTGFVGGFRSWLIGRCRFVCRFRHWFIGRCWFWFISRCRCWLIGWSRTGFVDGFRSWLVGRCWFVCRFRHWFISRFRCWFIGRDWYWPVFINWWGWGKISVNRPMISQCDTKYGKKDYNCLKKKYNFLK